jgi:hypothetical protein
MMSKINVTDEFVGQLLESRGWDKAGIRVDESKKEKKTGGGPEVEGAKEVGKSAYDNENNSPEGITEEHTCPLCEAKLDEELSDEVLEEHAGAMLGIFAESGLISEEMQVGEDFIIENANEILDILSEAGLIVEETEDEE